jgi:hypothetical protein
MEYLPSLTWCCNSCRRPWRRHAKDADSYKPVDLLEYGEETNCPTARKFRDLKKNLFEKYPVETLGKIANRSLTRSRATSADNGEYQVEMDWALITSDKWPKSLGDHMREQLKGLYLSRIKPGATIMATGRTSGSQFGQINNAMNIMRYGLQFTQEWPIIECPEYNCREWIEGGIGVDGDSGAWIIDRESGAVYGMAWGRDRITTQPICIFSPTEDIVADIKERTRARNVYLRGKEETAVNVDAGEAIGY